MSPIVLRSLLPPGFFADFWRRRPVVLRGAAAALCDVVTVHDVDRFVAVECSRPEGHRHAGLDILGDDVVFLRHAEPVTAALAELSTRVRGEFDWDQCDVAVIRNSAASCTGSHFDDTDNFIVQAEGEKHWLVWPPEEVTPSERRSRLLGRPGTGATPQPLDRSSVVELVAEPGDLLYVPLFWGHRATAVGPGLTVSIGIRAVTPLQSVLADLHASLDSFEDDAEPMPLPNTDQTSAHHAERLRARAAQRLGAELQARSAYGQPGVHGKGQSEGETRGMAHVQEAGVAKEVALPRHTNDAVGTMLAWPPSSPSMQLCLDWAARANLRAALRLLHVSPLGWPTDAVAARDRLIAMWNAMPEEALLAAAVDPVAMAAVDESRRFAESGHVRGALAALEEWSDRTERLRASDAAASATFVDGSCTIPAQLSQVDRLDGVIEQVDDCLPGLAAASRDLWSARVISDDPDVVRTARHRLRVAVLPPAGAQALVEETVVAEVARVVICLLGRIGLYRQAAPVVTPLACLSVDEALAQAAALAAAGDYLQRRGDDVGVGERLAAARLLLRAVHSTEVALTGLGRATLDSLEIRTRAVT